MNLWLDDERPAPHGWVWARDYAEALIFSKAIDFDAVSLDHDLGAGLSGYDFLCWLEARHNEGGRMPAVSIHTQNPVGRARMELALKAIRARQSGDAIGD